MIRLLHPAPLLLLLVAPAAAWQPRGAALFSAHCAHCHGADGRGGERGPDISNRDLASRPDLTEVIRKGLPSKGMPGTNLSGAPLEELAAFVRRIQPGRSGASRPAIPAAGPTWEQLARPRDGDWPSYHGDIGGNRHSPLAQITRSNVHALVPAWMYSFPGSPRLQMTPVVFDGVMYVTAVNEVHALDPANGRRFWSFRRPRTAGLAGDAASGINRGVAILGHRLFLATDNAHLLALDRRDGRLLWEVTMADSRENYGSTSAPLIAAGLVVAGVSGGDEGARGFLSAFHPEDGKLVWRFWTVPSPGEPGSETWKGTAWEHGCAATWLTGTFDVSQNLLFWAAGNPCPDYNGDEREGDNLYSNSVLALEPTTGKLRWHFQFTPHDLHDWDATQTPMVIDHGGRKLLAQANRNGFFYVLDRSNGKLIYAKPFVEKLTWASGVDQKTGRPVVNPEAAPREGGVKACPAVEGATNWFSTAFNPATGLFYVQALEKCTLYSKARAVWTPGQSFYGGDTRSVPGERGRKFLRAIDLETGERRWQIEQEGPANTWGGVLSTAGGLVFFGDDSGDFAAADAATGKRLWSWPANQLWKASPATYLAGGKQFVVVAAGSNVLAFALR